MFETDYTRTDAYERTVHLIESDADTDYMGYTLEIREPPHLEPSIAANMHRQWHERFEIIEGTAQYKIGDVVQTAVAGETVTMPAAQFHVNPYNGGDTELMMRQIVRYEARDTQAMTDTFGIVHTITGLGEEGKLNEKGLPKNPLQLAAVLHKLAGYEVYAADIPIGVQKFLAATLGRLAVALGYRAVYRRFLP